MQSFIETPRLSDVVSYGSTGGPGFKTFVFDGDSGVDGTYAGWEKVKAKYDLQYAIRDDADFETVRAMFYVCRGRATGFRMKDHADYVATDEPVTGLVNGVNTTFKLHKRYSAGSLVFDRRIFKPVSGTVTAKKNGVSTTVSSVDYTNGTMVLAVAPTGGDVITASFEFDIPVRFDTDNMDVAHDGHGLLTWGSVPLVEIILED